MTTPDNYCTTTEPDPKDPDRTRSPYFNPDSLCENGWQPLLLTGMFRDMLIRHFSDSKQIVAPDLKQFVWREDETSGILIESVYRWRADLVEKRPAILVKRNGYRQRRVGIQDKIFGMGTSGAISPNERGAMTRHMVHWLGSHTVFCIHGTGASCEILATEVVDQLTMNAPAIRQLFNLDEFQVTEVGAISELEESTENYVIPVTVGWVYQQVWDLHLDSLPLRDIAVNLDISDC